MSLAHRRSRFIANYLFFPDACFARPPGLGFYGIAFGGNRGRQADVCWAGNAGDEVSLFMPDMMFILILALLLFGPKKVPEIARKIAQFRNLGNELKSKLEAEFQQLEAETQNLVPSSVADFKETIQPLTQIREELETAISLDSDPQEKPPQTNPTASEKSSTTP